MQFNRLLNQNCLGGNIEYPKIAHSIATLQTTHLATATGHSWQQLVTPGNPGPATPEVVLYQEGDVISMVTPPMVMVSVPPYRVNHQVRLTKLDCGLTG